MKKNIKGFVKQDPVLLNNCCLFAVENEGELYLVLSTKQQAKKDAVFVRGGQEIRIRGSALEDEKFQGILLTEEAYIELHQSETGC